MKGGAIKGTEGINPMNAPLELLWSAGSNGS
jgi:hypothetical protein